VSEETKQQLDSREDQRPGNPSGEGQSSESRSPESPPRADPPADESRGEPAQADPLTGQAPEPATGDAGPQEIEQAVEAEGKPEQAPAAAPQEPQAAEAAGDSQAGEQPTPTEQDVTAQAVESLSASDGGDPSESESPASDSSGTGERDEPAETGPVSLWDTGGSGGPVEESAEEPVEEGPPKDWYILKVQSNREKSICDALRRRVKVAGFEEYFDEIIVPTEDVAEFKNGKKKIVKRKLYPGYIVVHMAINDETWFLVRETPGIGDFTGSQGRPTPMLPHEVERIIGRDDEDDEEGGKQVKPAIPFKRGDRVRIKEGNFENFEGDVDAIDETNGRVTVMITIFNRTTPVEFEYWQIESV